VLTFNYQKMNYDRGSLPWYCVGSFELFSPFEMCPIRDHHGTLR